MKPPTPLSTAPRRIRWGPPLGLRLKSDPLRLKSFGAAPLGLTWGRLSLLDAEVKTKRGIGKRRGRRKSGRIVRTRKTQCSLTPEDADWLQEFARAAGFQSRSQLMAAVLERLRACGFSPAGGFRLCLQIQQRLADRERRGLVAEKQRRFDWDSLLAPLPPLPPDTPVDAELEREALAELEGKEARTG